MKFINIALLLIVLFSSCNTTKKVAEKETIVKEKEVVITEKTTTTPEPETIVEKETPETTQREVVLAPAEQEVSIQETNTETPEPSIKKPLFNHDAWNTLLQNNVSNKGNVNYKGFKNNRTKLKEYITNLSTNMPNDTWPKEEVLAYWINAYNALTVDLILRNYPIKSIKDIKTPWDLRFWKLGEKWYNLNEIEHQILRKMNEPRIHFAIVCASFSCPKLSNKAYVAATMETQLTTATTDFLEDPLRNNLSKSNIKISKIFKWFAKDFKTNGTIIDFINKYATITIDSNAKRTFKDYNWSLNE